MQPGLDGPKRRFDQRQSGNDTRLSGNHGSPAHGTLGNQGPSCQIAARPQVFSDGEAQNIEPVLAKLPVGGDLLELGGQIVLHLKN